MGVVDFSVRMKPSARFEIKAPNEQGEEHKYVAAAGGLLLKILCMPHEERVAVLTDAAGDEVLILFAMLTPQERRDVLQAAETFLKEQVTKF